MSPRSSMPVADPAPLPDKGLAVVSIAKSYDKRVVLTDVSVSVGRGEVVGLLGPNGAGKTTCFYSVMGLVKPDSGRIMLDGEDITKLPMYRRAILGLGYLPQETSIFRGMTVEKNILAVLELSEPDKRARGAARQAARRIRPDPAARFAGDGAVGRRAAPRRDRPRAGRRSDDHAARRAVRGHRSDLDLRHSRPRLQLKTRGIGVLITDHNVRETLDIVDRGYIIYDGRVLFAGSPDELVATRMSAASISARASSSRQC
jgi:lipopolysaccharide export system ATP-binding protein